MCLHGEMRRAVHVRYFVCCADCDEELEIDAWDKKMAARVARTQFDWSLGRDKKWRCDRCRPRRFGERRG